ncbi:sigma-70 family RNA polymerase sigma factor [Lentzea sp. NEAU-D13]|uniref:Sigma-70 family RNA polymerase sigma factor n=1 Tax=Lentzea alba TaxID=2714351 RepID=A0A7C9W759_9PSEU|nr:sigma-70 family RNA polymerase sigma factor [Lentzea alba]NGY64700.1 sigma-70 family RNA polymerase sigma factor [Lentzea alba]
MAAVSDDRPDTVEALAARDADREAALAALFHRHHLELVRLATLLGAESDAEDVVADAFCELHRGWKRLRSEQAALPYLRAVIVNRVRMRVRHLQVVRKHVEWVREDVASAESQAMVRDDQRALVAALRDLPERQREALVLRYWLGLKEAEIAEAMGISAGAVKAHTARGMAKLGKTLEGQDDG